MARPKSGKGEFELIARYFSPLARSKGALGLRDDAAIVKPRSGYDLVVTKDAIVEGVHFLADDPWDLVAQKLLRVNLSDIAAKGARPFGYFLATAFPKGTSSARIAAFARGLAKDQSIYDISLLGGDTVAIPGPSVFSCTMLGWVAAGKMLQRNGARPGDDLWITGTLGDAAVGLAAYRGEYPGVPVATRRWLERRYRLPDPPEKFGQELIGKASAAMDVSDGLVQDAKHLATNGRVALSIDLSALPLSRAFVRAVSNDTLARLAAATGGDDYQILFAAEPKWRAALGRIASRRGISATIIGTVTKGTGVRVHDGAGHDVVVPKGGYTHF